MSFQQFIHKQIVSHTNKGDPYKIKPQQNSQNNPLKNFTNVFPTGILNLRPHPPESSPKSKNKVYIGYSYTQLRAKRLFHSSPCSEVKPDVRLVSRRACLNNSKNEAISEAAISRARIAIEERSAELARVFQDSLTQEQVQFEEDLVERLRGLKDGFALRKYLKISLARESEMTWLVLEAQKSSRVSNREAEILQAKIDELEQSVSKEVDQLERDNDKVEQRLMGINRVQDEDLECLRMDIESGKAEIEEFLKKIAELEELQANHSETASSDGDVSSEEGSQDFFD